jgi:AdoMet-dependent heme synthase
MVLRRDMQSAAMIPTRSRPASASGVDFAVSPFVVFYELTQACDLVCAHCRACAQPARNPAELSPRIASALLDDLARFPRPPLVVLTGGDPMKRPDVFDLVAHGTSRGLSMAMTPSATPLVTRDVLRRLASAGLSRLAVSIDGASADSHDRLRGVPGSFARSLEILIDARMCGLPLQVNTTVHGGNVGELPEIADLVDPYDLALWSVFFLVPVGRAMADARIRPEQYEEVFALLRREAAKRSYAIKTTEAPHYRRFVLQEQKRARRESRGAERTPASAATGMMGTNDGNGVLFVGHTGHIQPSGFLPLPCGRFPEQSVVEVYQSHPLFRSLRDSDGFSGKCGVCEFRSLCGGSRARAFALTGDSTGSDPDCAYVPPLWNRRASQSVR